MAGFLAGLYQDKREYYIQDQLEKVKFEEYKIRSQLESVNKRLSLLSDECRMNALFFLVILSIYAVSFGLLQLPSIPLHLIATVPYVVSLLALIFLSPVLIYRAVHGFVLYQLNLHSERYIELMKKWEISTYEDERRKCQSLLLRYEDYHGKLEQWSEQCREGTLQLSEEQIRAEFHQMILGDQIPVTNPFTGKLAVFTNAVTVLMWILPVAIGIIAVIRFAGTIR
ncbi:MAG: hypothetical protein K5739_02215 [Lachnospiraceae bacterium]|nr:hypothetical protein [Lachnospiraceae bacterium]